MTPTARSLAYLRAQGYHAYVVERWIPQARVRKDVAGFMDILAWSVDHGPDQPAITLAVQATTGANLSARQRKIECGGLTVSEYEAFEGWKACGHKVCIHGWAKQGARGKRKLWTLREVWV